MYITEPVQKKQPWGAMKGAIELFASGSSKIDYYTLSRKYTGCIINPNRKAACRNKNSGVTSLRGTSHS